MTDHSWAIAKAVAEAEGLVWERLPEGNQHHRRQWARKMADAGWAPPDAGLPQGQGGASTYAEIKGQEWCPVYGFAPYEITHTHHTACSFDHEPVFRRVPSRTAGDAGRGWHRWLVMPRST